MNTNY